MNKVVAVMRKFLMTFLVAASLAPALPALAADEGKAKPHGADWVKEKAQVCASCHGKDGVSQTPMYPTIAGQYESYLVHVLEAYRDGDRNNAIMAGQVQGMTDAQIKALARFYAKQESPLHVPELNP